MASFLHRDHELLILLISSLRRVCHKLIRTLMHTKASAWCLVLLALIPTNNGMQDLGSTNQLHVCAALTALSHLISEETIPAVLPLVTELLQHEK